MSLFGDLKSGILDGAQVSIETSLTPPVLVDLKASESRPSLLLNALRPRIVVLLEGQEVATYTPNGDPTEIRPFVIAGVALLFCFLFWRAFVK